MSNFYAETRAIVESKASTLSKYTYDTYLSHLRKLQMYRPTAECSDITEAFVFGYIDFMHARKNSAGCIYRSLSILRMFIRELLRRRKMRRDPMRDFPLKKVRKAFLASIGHKDSHEERPAGNSSSYSRGTPCSTMQKSGSIS